MTEAGTLLGELAALPLSRLGDVLPGRFLVVAPHPDDESLGVGGLIAEACRSERPPVVVVLTDGAASHPGSRAYPPDRLSALRAGEVREAVGLLGLPAANLFLLGAPDTAAPHDGPAAQALAERIAELAEGCGTILTSWRHDPHCDHLAAWHIASLAAAISGARLMEYPVWGWSLPVGTVLPDGPWSGWRFDVSAHLPAKREAIAAHRSQHGGLITDDPGGFVLPADFVSLFDRDFECLVIGP